MTPSETKLIGYTVIGLISLGGLLLAALAGWKVVASDMLILLAAYLFNQLS
jgi:hypothetical protein